VQISDHTLIIQSLRVLIDFYLQGIPKCQGAVMSIKLLQLTSASFSHMVDRPPGAAW